MGLVTLAVREMSSEEGVGDMVELSFSFCIDISMYILRFQWTDQGRYHGVCSFQ